MRRKDTPPAPQRPIRTIRVTRRYRRDLGDIAALAASIDDVGLLHPIVVTPGGRLIAGARRLAAVRQLGWREVPVHLVDLDEIARGELAENTLRKDFLPSEIAAIARAVDAKERAAAKARQRAGLKRGTQPPRSANLAERKNGQTRDRKAAVAGVSHGTLDKIEAVVAAAEREPEHYASLVEEMDRTGRVHGVYRKLIKQEQATRIAAEPPPLPDGQFRVIVADPPWPYSLRANDASHRGALDYPEMSLDAIRALDIGQHAAQDCILWLWTTNSHLRQAFDVLDAWAFTYKTCLTWVKDRMGVGDWLRGQTEHCLLAVRGKPTLLLTNQTTALRAPARGHSAKPDEFYALVESLCPGSRLELFARERRAGWVQHGSGFK